MKHNNIINMCEDLGWCPAHLLVGGRSHQQCHVWQHHFNMGNLNMCVVENVRDQKWKAKCAQACVKSDPQKSQTTTVNYFCDTKALIEVSYRIRPTSESISLSLSIYIYIYIYKRVTRQLGLPAMKEHCKNSGRSGRWTTSSARLLEAWGLRCIQTLYYNVNLL